MFGSSSGENHFGALATVAGKGVSVNGLEIAGCWRVSGEIRRVCAGSYVDVLPDQWAVKQA